MALRKGTITEGGKKITWQQTAEGVTYSDGKLAMPSPDNMDAKIAYKSAKMPVVEPPIIIIPPSPGTSREIGNKELSVLRDVQDESFVLKSGIYKDRCDWVNLNNVTIVGAGKVQFETVRRAIQANGNVNGITLQGLSFKNIDDYCIDFWGNGSIPYNGKSGSFIDGFKLIDVVAENCGAVFHCDGDFQNGVHRGVLKNLVISGLRFINSPEPRSAVYVGNGMDYDISGCVVDNINYTSSDKGSPNGVHNGIFQMGGNGRFYNNRVTNHQGNAIRAWLFSQEGRKTVEIANNIVFNSRKYSAFELQNVLKAAPADAKIHHNTVGLMNTSKDWQGQVVDVYYTGGNLEYYDNLAFQLNRSIGGPSISTGITDGINQAGDTPKIIRNSGNRYFATSAEAVADTIAFKSLHAGIGAQ